MTLASFCDRLIHITADEKTGTVTVEPSAGSELSGRFFGELRTMFSEKEMQASLTRKYAARVLHLYLLTVPGDTDEDWKDAASLRDIYECRICANAIAQVCVKGIMRPVNKKEFGTGLPVSDEEAEEILIRIKERL